MSEIVARHACPPAEGCDAITAHSAFVARILYYGELDSCGTTF